MPTEQPSKQPTEHPTEQPSEQPTEEPSRYPTEDPSAQPTDERPKRSRHQRRSRSAWRARARSTCADPDVAEHYAIATGRFSGRLNIPESWNSIASCTIEEPGVTMSSSASSMLPISCRARFAPRQKWGPCPNVISSRLSRSKSISSGLS